MSALVRGSSGNHVYTSAQANHSFSAILDGESFLENLSGSYLRDGFTQRQIKSHHYLENASFVRLEYLQIGYDFGSFLNGKAGLSLTGTVQNAFVITKYSGQDPEVAGGIDYGQYPMPRTYSLGLNFSL